VAQPPAARTRFVLALAAPSAPTPVRSVPRRHRPTRAAERFARRDREFWRRGPLHPRTWSVVVVSRRDALLHANRRDCRAPDCPVAATAAPAREDVSR
jgi:hypothetical protein